MDASLQTRAEQLAREIAGEATTVDDLNNVLRLMMKSTLERMPNSDPAARKSLSGAGTVCVLTAGTPERIGTTPNTGHRRHASHR